MADYTIASLIGFKPRLANSSRASAVANGLVSRPGIFGEEVFQNVLLVERHRAERSRRPFVLVLVHSNTQSDPDRRVLQRAVSTLVSNTRESDLIGWYRESVTLGIIFTEINQTEKVAVAQSLRKKVVSALLETVGRDGISKLAITGHIFPEDWDRDNAGWIGDSKLYPELQPRLAKKRVHLALKRVIDVAGSTALLFLALPFLAAIALLVKLTSKGPVLYEQERLGQFGARFKCLKFRTMYTDCDAKIHREYVQQFIAGNAQSAHAGDSQKALYKITGDPRVTPIGRILRKTSLDEFPQFWNVLRGEMSLVGPRPPVPYEFEVYDVWHRRRVLELKPGVTGLWQVSGRNRTRFDEMVRLDLRYSQKWSLWLDLKILLATPWAMFSGDCA
ncbi:MAG: glycosyl transferase [Acidobacteria bacterium]|nr:MAG: glycosyl transferase [Acidobacteriota bacterium]